MRNKELATKLEQFESLLKQRDQKPLNFVEAAKYLSISQSTLYKLSYQRKIPSYKPSGKLLYFFKHELDEWIVKNGKEHRVKPTTAGKGKELKDTDDDEPDG